MLYASILPYPPHHPRYCGGRYVRMDGGLAAYGVLARCSGTHHNRDILMKCGVELEDATA